MDETDFGIGFVAGVLLLSMAWFYFGGPSNSEALDNCAKTHNVYQCEMVALPKGPK